MNREVRVMSQEFKKINSFIPSSYLRIYDSLKSEILK